VSVLFADEEEDLAEAQSPQRGEIAFLDGERGKR